MKQILGRWLCPLTQSHISPPLQECDSCSSGFSSCFQAPSHNFASYHKYLLIKAQNFFFQKMLQRYYGKFSAYTVGIFFLSFCTAARTMCNVVLPLFFFSFQSQETKHSFPPSADAAKWALTSLCYSPPPMSCPLVSRILNYRKRFWMTSRSFAFCILPVT